MLALAVFDLDGTLIDSRRDLAESVNELLDGYGAPPLAEREVGRMVGSGAERLVARALRAAGVNAPLEEALDRFLAIYDRHLTTHTRPYRGVPEMLGELRAAGVRTTLLTNKPLRQSLTILERLGLAGFFERCVGGDGPWPRKPAPEGLESLIRAEAATRGATAMIGDSPVDLQTARRGGVRAVVARYGFGFAGFAQGDLTAEDLVVDEPAEISGALRSLGPAAAR